MLSLRAFGTAGLLGVAGSFLLICACGSSSEAVGPGGECSLATDCAPGLVCIQRPDKSRVCSSDLTNVAGKPPTQEPDAAAAGDASRDGGDAAKPVKDGAAADTSVPDTSVPDTAPPEGDAADQ